MYLRILTQQRSIKVRFMSEKAIVRLMTLAVLLATGVSVASAIVAQFLQTFREFPPRAKPGSFSLDQALQKMQLPSNN